MAGRSPFEALLQGMLSDDNATRQAAEASFVEAKSTPDALVGNLVAVLRGSQNQENRSLSAVMLRRVSLVTSLPLSRTKCMIRCLCVTRAIRNDDLS